MDVALHLLTAYVPVEAWIMFGGTGVCLLVLLLYPDNQNVHRPEESSEYFGQEGEFTFPPGFLRKEEEQEGE